MDSTATRIIRRLTLGSIAVFMGQGINILGQILVVPLFLWAWGPQLYGEWLALYAVVAYFSLLDFGMQAYVINRLNQCYSVGQLKDYSCILHSALVLYLSVAIVAVSLTTAALSLAPVEQWLNFKLMDHQISAIVAIFLATQIIFAIPQGLIIGLYRTLGEFPRGATIRNLRQGCTLGFVALVLLFGGNVIHVAAIQLIPPLGAVAFALRDLKNRHPELNIGLAQSHWKMAITFLAPSLLFFLIQISNALILQGSIIVVSVFAGSPYVAVFAIHRTLTNLIRQIVGSLNNALWPELTTLEATDNYSLLRVVHRSFVKISFGICVIAGIWLHFVGKDIMSLWTLGRITFDQRLLDVFIIYLIFQAPWLASGLFPASFNRHRNLAICYFLSAVSGLGLALGLVRHLGIVGVALGLLIADILVCGWFVPLDTCRILGDNVRKFWVSVAMRGFPVIALGWVVTRLAIVYISPPIPRILVALASLTLIALCAGYFLWLNKAEKRNISSLGTNSWFKVANTK
ncbi:MAG: hypothetical protein ACFFDT_20215 [Candidatus Hodarchaeota archaeon]